MACADFLIFGLAMRLGAGCLAGCRSHHSQEKEQTTYIFIESIIHVFSILKPNGKDTIFWHWLGNTFSFYFHNALFRYLL